LNSKGGLKPIPNLKERKPLLIKLLAIVLLVVICWNLPEELYFRWLCREQDRNLPPDTEVIVSACKDPVAVGVPGGETVFVYENRTETGYLLDLRTGEKRNVPNDPLLLDKGKFLSSDLVWLEGSLVGPGQPGYRPHYILDVTDGERYELIDLQWKIPDSIFDNGELNPDLFPYFLDSENVFIHHSRNRVIFLSLDFQLYPERNAIFPQNSLGTASLSARKGELLEQLMKNLGVPYEVVDLSLLYADVPSPTGRYIVRSDGIYVSETNEQVMGRDAAFFFVSWYYDESGVVFQKPGPFLISHPLLGSHYLFPSPILKLHLPVD
jgi:hypothetical protein